MTWGRGGQVSGRPDRRLRMACFRRDNWTCQGCGYESPRRDGRDLHADHTRNRAAGGPKTLENLQTLCPPCHLLKTLIEARAAKQRHIRPRPVHPADLLRGGGA